MQQSKWKEEKEVGVEFKFQAVAVFVCVVKAYRALERT